MNSHQITSISVAMLDLFQHDSRYLVHQSFPRLKGAKSASNPASRDTTPVLSSSMTLIYQNVSYHPHVGGEGQGPEVHIVARF